MGKLPSNARGQLMKISIIVPTRNRSEYLGYCLATCLAPADKDIEVIVSDNNSTDQTREVVSGIEDSRLRYFNTGKSVSMRQNYEFALSQATGDYLIIIGDDDGLLNNGLKTLRLLIDRYRPDVINWKPINYKWPRTQPTPDNGVLKFSSRYFFGPLHRKHPADILTALCNATVLQYRDGANLYHGCIARPVIDALKMKTGDYFQAHNPDVYSSLANLSVARSFLWITNPITIGGESEKSQGAASASWHAQTEQQAKISADFRSLSDSDPIVAEINMKVRLFSAHTYAVLTRINTLLYEGSLRINHERWRDAIWREAARLPPDLRNENQALLLKCFSEFDPQYHPTAFSAHRAEAPSEASRATKVKRQRGRTVAAHHTKTVATVAQWVDSVTGGAHSPAESATLAALFHLWKVVETEVNTRRTS
jgi:glycosyltransferase involved in cell wall biosynthesis